MEGPLIVARTLSLPGTPDRFGNVWQYHSRSDRHSKVACWAILFEMLQHSALLRRHAEAGRVVFGVNLPSLVEGPTSAVLVALEAKACMTAHIKALPRLFDELNSSHVTIHANTDSALAVGFAMVNASPTFVSSDLNKHDLAKMPAVISEHRQPLWATRTVAKLTELPRRAGRGQEGFDALGIVVVDMANDGTPVRVVDTPPAPKPADVFHYDQMMHRLSHQYETAYSALNLCAHPEARAAFYGRDYRRMPGEPRPTMVRTRATTASAVTATVTVRTRRDAVPDLVRGIRPTDQITALNSRIGTPTAGRNFRISTPSAANEIELRVQASSVRASARPGSISSRSGTGSGGGAAGPWLNAGSPWSTGQPRRPAGRSPRWWSRVSAAGGYGAAARRAAARAGYCATPRS